MIKNRVLAAFVALAIILSSCGRDVPVRDARPTRPPLAGVSAIYFPVVWRDGPRQSVQIFRGGGWGNLQHFQALSLHSVRYSYGTSSSPGIFTDYSSDPIGATAAFHDDWTAVQLSAGLTFVPSFVGNQAQTCEPLQPSEYDAFADLVVTYAELFELRSLEIWNEADLLGGMPGMFGCWGLEYTGEFVELLSTVRLAMDASGLETTIGSSFAVQSQDAIQMVQAAEPYLDWVGVHYYGDWDESTGWTVGYPNKIGAVKSAVNIPVYITETNLRYTGDCTLQQFEDTQAAFVEQMKGRQIAGFTVFELVEQDEAWRCAAMLEEGGAPLPVYYVLGNN